MKWIGQHIVDLIARFRSDVYLDGLTTTTDTSVLVVDSNNKICKSTSVAGDITSVGAGTGLTGGGTSSAVTLDVIGGVGITANANDIALTNGLIADGSNITSVGTIGTGVWRGDAVGSSYLDADTAHLSGNQTFSGTKTFNSTISGDIDGEAATVATIAGLAPNTATTQATQPNIESIGTSGDTLSILGDYLSMSSSALMPGILLTNTNTSVSSSASLAFRKDAADTEDGEVLGTIQFQGEDEGNNLTTFASIQGFISESDETDEAGKLILSVAESDGTDTFLSPGLILEGEHATDGEVDATIGNGAASVTTVAGTLTMGSTAAMTNAGLVAVVNQSNITGLGTITSGTWNGTALATAYIADDAVTFAKASGVTPIVYGSIIKLLPSDFVANDDGGVSKVGIAYVDHAGATYGMKPNNAATELYAFVSIPEGMKATHVDVYDNSHDLAIEVFEVQINATTMTSKGSGNANTTLDITDVNSSATNFLAIQVTTVATSNRVYGGSVTIAA